MENMPWTLKTQRYSIVGATLRSGLTLFVCPQISKITVFSVTFRLILAKDFHSTSLSIIFTK